MTLIHPRFFVVLILSTVLAAPSFAEDFYECENDKGDSVHVSWMGFLYPTGVYFWGKGKRSLKFEVPRTTPKYGSDNTMIYSSPTAGNLRPHFESIEFTLTDDGHGPLSAVSFVGANSTETFGKCKAAKALSSDLPGERKPAVGWEECLGKNGSVLTFRLYPTRGLRFAIQYPGRESVTGTSDWTGIKSPTHPSYTMNPQTSPQHQHIIVQTGSNDFTYAVKFASEDFYQETEVTTEDFDQCIDVTGPPEKEKTQIQQVADARYQQRFEEVREQEQIAEYLRRHPEHKLKLSPPLPREKTEREYNAELERARYYAFVRERARGFDSTYYYYQGHYYTRPSTQYVPPSFNPYTGQVFRGTGDVSWPYLPYKGRPLR